jgi:hypothetical protein
VKETSTVGGEAPSAASVAETRPVPPAYEPPAVAWEEPFEPMAGTSCALDSPFNGNCTLRPTV